MRKAPIPAQVLLKTKYIPVLVARLGSVIVSFACPSIWRRKTGTRRSDSPPANIPRRDQMSPLTKLLSSYPCFKRRSDIPIPIPAVARGRKGMCSPFRRGRSNDIKSPPPMSSMRAKKTGRFCNDPERMTTTNAVSDVTVPTSGATRDISCRLIAVYKATSA